MANCTSFGLLSFSALEIFHLQLLCTLSHLTQFWGQNSDVPLSLHTLRDKCEQIYQTRAIVFIMRTCTNSSWTEYSAMPIVLLNPATPLGRTHIFDSGGNSKTKKASLAPKPKPTFHFHIQSVAIAQVMNCVDFKFRFVSSEQSVLLPGHMAQE